MGLINLIISSWILGAPTQAGYVTLVKTGPQQAALFHLSEKMSITLLTIDKTGKAKQKKISLTLSEPLFHTRITPMGEKRVPAWSFMGLKGQNAVLFNISHHQILETSLPKSPLPQKQQFPLLFPRNPKGIHKINNNWLLTASLVTTPDCKGCECGYFHEFNADWKPIRCFGEGKSFYDSFMKGDIPTVFWFLEEERGGIFYHKTKDLYLYSVEGTENIVKTRFVEDPAPKSRRRITSGMGTTLLTTRTASDVSLFALDETIWKRVGHWEGKWEEAIPIGKWMIFLREDGNLETTPISGKTKL